jgi:dipeptidase E
MKLYLSSIRLPDPGAWRELFAPDQTHQVALITNAWDNAPTKISEPFIEASRQQIIGEGFGCERLDLHDFINKPKELEAALQKYAGVWVTGGNSFYLNWLIAETGFASVLKRLLDKGFVYGGESAGAAVAGTTLHGIEALDSITEAPHAIWQGMGLVPYGIVPHWGEPKYTLYLERCRREMAEFGRVKVLTNDQYIIVND